MVKQLEHAPVSVRTPGAAPFRNEDIATKQLVANLRQRTINSGFVTSTAQGAKFILNLISTVVLARLLSPADFGLVAMVTAVTSFLYMLRDAGLSTATIQRENITNAQVSNLFWINVGLGGCVTCLVAVLAPFISWFYREPPLLSITLVMSLTFVLRSATVQHVALLTRQMRFQLLAFIEVGSVTVGLLTGVILAVLRLGYWSLVGMTLSVEVATVVLVWGLFQWRPQWPTSGVGTRLLINFGLSITASSFVASLANSSDSLLIGWRYGAAPVGLYTRAAALFARPLEQIISPISSVFVPALARLQNDPARYRRAFLQGYEVMTIATFCATSVIFALARPLTMVLLGNKWAAAGNIFACFAIVALVRPLIFGAYWLPTSQGRGSCIVVTSVIAAISCVISFIVGLPFGPIGVALAFSISGLLVRLPIVFYTCGQEGPVRTSELWSVFLRNLPLWIIPFLLTSLVHLLLQHEPPLGQVAICMPMGFAVAGVCTLIFPHARGAVLPLIKSIWKLVPRRPYPA